jgi:general secretion pathway protein D
MNKIYRLKLFFLIFLVSGCSLIDVNKRQDTKKYILKGIEGNLTHVSNSSNNDLLENNNLGVEDVSSYIYNNNNLQQISNISNPVQRRAVFNSDLQVINKHFDNKKVTISIEEMPLNKFLHLVFGKVLEVDYVLDQSIQKNTQPVSINLKDKISKKDFLKIINNMLEAFNVVIDIEKDIFYIKKSTHSLRESVDKIYLGESVPRNLDDQQTIYMMRPYYYNKYINKYNRFVKNYFLSKNGKVTIDRDEHIIKIKDKVSNIKKALAFYSFMDQPTLRNKNMKLIHMDNIDVQQFIEQMKPILKGYGIPISEHIRSLGIQFVAIKPINSFLLISEKKSWTQTVLFWKEKLDVVEESMDESKFFVYTPRNRKASELVNIVNSFKESVKKKDTDIIKEESTKLNDSKDKKRGGLQLVEDKERNNILIYGTKSEYSNIVKMLKRLDSLPKQVLVEVTIAEITLRDSMQFGLEWFLKEQGSDYGLVLNALGAGSAGISGILSATSGNFGAGFNALQTNKYVNVLSNPKLLVLNNHSASINVGNQIPIITSQASASDLEGGSTSSSILQNIEYRNTGIQLTVKPTINSEGYLTLNISQNVSNAQKNDTSDISSPLIFTRSIATDVILKSGEMVLLGGLITEDKSLDKTMIPLLGSIPLLGKLFSTQGESIDKTELVIMVKPTIITSDSDARIVTDTLLNLINFN